MTERIGYAEFDRHISLYIAANFMFLEPLESCETAFQRFKNREIRSHIQRVTAIKLTATYAFRHLCMGGYATLDLRVYMRTAVMMSSAFTLLM